MPTLSLRAWIGNAAAALCGRHGDVTTQAARGGCSRQTVYDHADKVQRAVADARLPGPSREQLLEDHRRLRDENRQLWQWLEEALDCPQSRQRHFAVHAAALGLSLQQTLALLALLLPPGRLPSRAALGRWVQAEARQAGRLLQALDRACQALVLTLCLDEIFFHRKPVLMGIEPCSLAWVLGARAADRSGPTWAKALAAWPRVRDVAADGGSGIELGLRLAAGKRQEDADQAKGEAVPVHVRLDVFHIRREGERASRADWQQAEAAWEAAEKVEHAKGRFDRGGTDGRRFSKAAVDRAWGPAITAFEEAEKREQAWRRAVAALGVFRPDGRLNDRAWAAAELPGPRWAKARRMLLDARALTFLDRLHEELAAAEPAAARRPARAARGRGGPRPPQAGPAAGAGVGEARAGLLGARLGEGAAASYSRVGAVLRRVVRTSSAVECVHSVVRMHQARHRPLSQALVDLKRLYWNCRPFVAGKRRKHCP